MNGLQRGFVAYYRWTVGRDQGWRTGPVGNTREKVEMAVGDAWGDCDTKPQIIISRLPRRLSRAPYPNWGLRGIDEQMGHLVAPYGRRFFRWWHGRPE